MSSALIDKRKTRYLHYRKQDCQTGSPDKNSLFYASLIYESSYVFKLCSQVLKGPGRVKSERWTSQSDPWYRHRLLQTTQHIYFVILISSSSSGCNRTFMALSVRNGMPSPTRATVNMCLYRTSLMWLITAAVYVYIILRRRTTDFNRRRIAVYWKGKVRAITKHQSIY